MKDAKGWEQRFDRFLDPFLKVWRSKKRRHWAPLYLRGLLLPGERKSIEPIAERVAPGHHQELRHFVSESEWDDDELEAVLWGKADSLLGGNDAVAIVDDTALPKKGDHSVGVAHQYCGALGKLANCQSLVSIALARNDVPTPVTLSLYLPEEWITDKKRREAAGVPDDVEFRAKWRIALDDLNRLRKAGVKFGTVLADAGYGVCAEFRDGLSEMGLLWALGVQSHHRVYPAGTRVRMPSPRTDGGRPRKHGVPTQKPRSVAEAIEELEENAFHRVTWRKGTKGPLCGVFAGLRVRLGDGGKISRGDVLPGTDAWLVCEQLGDDRKYYLTNHPATAKLRTLVAAIKARWSCEQVHQQLKEELGLDHFEGRSWRGLRHHALLTMIAFSFLQHERVRENKTAA